MGITVFAIEVGNPDHPDRTERLDLLIDSGAVYSVVPSAVLRKLHLKPLSEQEFRLASGERIVRKKGRALFRYGEKLGVSGCDPGSGG